MKQLQDDDMMRQFWQHSRKEAPEGFSDFVMQKLPQAKPLPEALKKPLLSAKAVALMLGMLAVLLVLLAKLGTGSQERPDWYQPMEHALSGTLSWLSSSSLLPGLALLSAAAVLLMGLDRLLQRIIRSSEQH